MSLSAKIYQFLTEKVDAAASDDLLFSADVHETDFDEIKRALTIRVGDSISEPLPGAVDSVNEYNGELVLEIVARPEAQTTAKRVEARETASAAALRIAQLIGEDEELSGRVCETLVTKKLDTWGNAGNARHAVSRLKLEFNPSSRT